MKVFTLIVWVLNLLLKKLKDLLDIKTQKEYKQANSMCGYFCIGFIDFMFAGRSLIDFTSLFSP